MANAVNRTALAAVVALLLLAAFFGLGARTSIGPLAAFLYVLPVAIVALSRNLPLTLGTGVLALALTWLAGADGPELPPSATLLSRSIASIVIAGVTALAALYAGATPARQTRSREVRPRSAEAADRDALPEPLASEEEYRTAFELAAVGSGHADCSTGRFMRVNRRLCEITGFSPEQLLEKSWLDLLAPAERERHAGAFRALAEGSAAEFGSEARAVRADGRPFWVQANLTVLRSAEGTAERCLVLIQDITARRRAQHEADNRLNEIEAILAAVPAAIWITRDPECSSITASGAAYRLLGLRPDEVSTLGAAHAESCRVLRDGVELPPEQHPLRVCTRTGAELRGIELELAFPDGRLLHLFGNATPLRDASGAISGAVAAFMDITRLKDAENRLAEQTRELERSNAELEQFAYVASHDLRSPLLSLNGCVQLLAEQYAGVLDPEADELLTYIRQSVSHMADLIRSLLDYSRVGSRPLELIGFPAASAVETALHNLRGAIEDSGAEVVVRELPTIHADQKQLTQLFQNLIDNAIKYRSERPPRIEIDSRAQNGEWLFHVRDNGIGIEPQHFAKLFQIFQRLHRDESRYPGSGVGLAICKKIIERHGGRIWVESEPGQGTAFCFTLPRQTPAVARQIQLHG